MRLLTLRPEGVESDSSGEPKRRATSLVEAGELDLERGLGEFAKVRSGVAVAGTEGLATK